VSFAAQAEAAPHENHTRTRPAKKDGWFGILILLSLNIISAT
jgi:hypothetical protein